MLFGGWTNGGAGVHRGCLGDVWSLDLGVAGPAVPEPGASQGESERMWSRGVRARGRGLLPGVFERKVVCLPAVMRRCERWLNFCAFCLACFSPQSQAVGGSLTEVMLRAFAVRC